MFSCIKPVASEAFRYNGFWITFVSLKLVLHKHEGDLSAELQLKQKSLTPIVKDLLFLGEKTDALDRVVILPAVIYFSYSLCINKSF